MDGDYFTLEEAEELLPEVSLLVEEAVSVHQELKIAYAKAFAVTSIGEKELLSNELIADDHPEKSKKRIKVLTQELNDILEELEEMGVYLSDLENGSVEFPSVFQGKEIYFAWKSGDESIEYWCEADSTYMNKILRLGE